MRQLYIPTIAPTATVLSISPMREEAAWRWMLVWDKEAQDRGYGQSRPRKEGSWTKMASALQMMSAI